ncbi:MAG TPA: SMP-30/gluconolactonase/LRE family protein [Methylomirabilota bacterium]|nr:SMP-30/gluconolactonase/LRE family protein [Methylomirabilota bacterium]
MRLFWKRAAGWCGMVILAGGTFSGLGADGLAVSTLAGLPGSYGAEDGVAEDARFAWPTGIARDNQGNLYVADANNEIIRKITPAGVVTTLAGRAREGGSVDGVGSEARLSSPRAVAVDGEGNVYVAEEYSNTIRRITPEGLVTTFAGKAGESGNADGMGQDARFDLPRGLAVDGEGNVYVADQGNARIRRITPAGMVTTLPGTFSMPEGLAVDSAGNIYVGDWGSDQVYKLTAEGWTLLAGGRGPGYQDGLGFQARFNDPTGVALDGEGNLYVTDTLNSVIRKVTPEGETTTIAGRPQTEGALNGVAEEALFQYPRGVVVDPAGNLFIADSNNNCIRQVTPEGMVSTLAGLSGGSVDEDGVEARFMRPEAVVLDDQGNAYVADTLNHAIRKITPDGMVTTLAGLMTYAGAVDGTGRDARFAEPRGVAVDGDGNLYVSDSANQTIRKVTVSGVVTTIAGLAGARGSADGPAADARFSNPMGIAIDPTGAIWVADRDNATIRRISPEGLVSTVAGVAGQRASVDGLGSDARFRGPSGIALDPEGNLYIADLSDHTIRKLASDGMVSTVAGLSGEGGTKDGVGSEARFWNPRGVAVDAGGNVYVGDWFNRTIRRIDPQGNVTTMAGLARVHGGADGVGDLARFFGTAGLCFGPDDRLYIADQNNNAIRVGVRVPGLTVQASSEGLTIGWPDWAEDYLLEESSTPGSGAGWTVVNDDVITVDEQRRVDRPLSGTSRFFRLRKP